MFCVRVAKCTFGVCDIFRWFEGIAYFKDVEGHFFEAGYRTQHAYHENDCD